MEAIRTKTTFFTSENTRLIFEDVFFTGIAREAAGIQSPIKNWGFHLGNNLYNKPGLMSLNENEIGYWKHEGKKYLLAMESRSHCQIHSQPYNCVPRSNAFIEQIFFLLNVQRTDERNSLKPSTVEAIVSIKANAGFSYNEAYDLFLKEKKLLEAVTSGAKYLS
uniref:Uncharacterized protein n=1 Tax=Acrobeloides nanus TaxID=290746 RepID=A0A914DP56_9BILA